MTNATKYRFRAGEQINGDTLCVGYQSVIHRRNGMALAINTANGDIYCGDPLLGMSHVGTLAEVPAIPRDGTDERQWQRWAARCREAIRERFANLA